MSYSSEVLADSPLAYWRQGESSGTTMVDASPNVRDGSYSGSPTLGSTSLLVGDADTSVTYGGGSFGTHAWASWMDVASGSVEALFATTNTSIQMIAGRYFSGSNAWMFVDLQASNVIRVYARISGTVRTASATVTGLRDGNPHHVVGTYDGTTLRLYVDGVERATFAQSGALSSSGQAFLIGRRNDSGSGAFAGRIDDVAVYDYALSSARVLAHYNAAAGVVGGTTVNLGLASEASTVHAVTASVGKLVSLGVVAESTTVHAVASAVGTVVALGVVSETTTAHAVTMVEGQQRNFPTITETTTVHAVTPLLAYVVSLGVVTETTTVQALSVVDGEVVTLGLITETTTLFALAVDLGYATTSRDITSGRIRRGVGYATWTPAVTPIPPSLAAGTAVDKALAFSAVTIVGTQPTFDVTEAAQPRHRDRIIIGGRDVTYFRGAETLVSNFQLIQPFAYGTATIEFPQVYPEYEEIGAGDLAWLAPGKKVTIQRVDAAGTVVATDYKGRLIAPNASTGTFSYEVGGEITGVAALRYRTMPLFRSTQDVGRQIWRALWMLDIPSTPRLGVDTGIELGRVGGMPFLDYLQQLVGRAWTRNGNQWTVMPDDDGAYETRRKDRSTVHGTVYLSASSVEADLRRDISEEPNRVFATGVTPSGMRVRFGVYPGLDQGDPPPFPGALSEGDSGDDVLTLIHRLRVHGYLDADTTPANTFGADVRKAVEAAQEDAELPVTGVANERTWEAIFDTTAQGLSLKLSRIEPAAQRNYTRRYRQTPSGAVLGLNPNYDPTRIRIDREIDFGAGFKRSQMREWSKAEIVDGATSNWVGTLTIHSGAIVAGEHTPGDPITDIMAARDVRPGMNLWLPQFQGGTLVHVTAATVSGAVVTLQVDTRARDAWNVAQVIERDRESRKDPARAFFRRLAASGVQKDALSEWSEVGGIITQQLLQGDRWNVIEVVGGDSGTIQKILLDTTPHAQSAVAVFGKKVWPNVLQSEIGNPLSEDGTERWSNENVLNRLRRDHGLLYSAGSQTEPGGYSPGSLGADGSGILTGRFEDEAGVQYYTDQRPILYVAIWVDRNTVIPAGRIMWPQLEVGV